MQSCHVCLPSTSIYSGPFPKSTSWWDSWRGCGHHTLMAGSNMWLGPSKKFLGLLYRDSRALHRALWPKEIQHMYIYIYIVYIYILYIYIYCIYIYILYIYIYCIYIYCIYICTDIYTLICRVYIYTQHIHVYYMNCTSTSVYEESPGWPQIWRAEVIARQDMEKRGKPTLPSHDPEYSSIIPSGYLT